MYQPQWAPPPPPRGSNPILIVSIAVGVAIGLFVIFLGLIVILGEPVRNNAYSEGHSWGHAWWVSQGSPDTAGSGYPESECAKAGDGLVQPGDGPPVPTIPSGGRDQWVHGCIVGLSGK